MLYLLPAIVFAVVQVQIVKLLTGEKLSIKNKVVFLTFYKLILATYTLILATVPLYLLFAFPDFPIMLKICFGGVFLYILISLIGVWGQYRRLRTKLKWEITKCKVVPFVKTADWPFVFGRITLSIVLIIGFTDIILPISAHENRFLGWRFEVGSKQMKSNLTEGQTSRLLHRSANKSRKYILPETQSWLKKHVFLQALAGLFLGCPIGVCLT